MNISNLSKKVETIFDLLSDDASYTKLLFAEFVFEDWANKNIKDENNIFLPENIGLENTISIALKDICTSIFNMVGKEININKYIEMYNKLSYIEKIDIITLLMIEYDNSKLFENKFTLPKIDDKISIENIVNNINNYRKSINNYNCKC